MQAIPWWSRRASHWLQQEGTEAGTKQLQQLLSSAGAYGRGALQADAQQSRPQMHHSEALQTMQGCRLADTQRTCMHVAWAPRPCRTRAMLHTEESCDMLLLTSLANAAQRAPTRNLMQYSHAGSFGLTLGPVTIRSVAAATAAAAISLPRAPVSA